MNKPKRWLLATGAVAAVLPLSMLGAAAVSAQASPGSGKVTAAQVGRTGESEAQGVVEYWGWPIGWGVNA